MHTQLARCHSICLYSTMENTLWPVSVFVFGKAYRVVLAQCGRLAGCEAHVLISRLCVIWISVAGYVGFVSRCIPSQVDPVVPVWVPWPSPAFRGPMAIVAGC